MLQSIRDRAHGMIAWIIIGLLIIPFALWGISGYIQGSSSVRIAAKVNGETIDESMVQAQAERSHEGSAQTLQDLIDKTFLTQAAVAEGFVLSPTFLQALLTPYEQHFRLSPIDIANFRNDMIVNQFPLGIQKSSFVLPSEIQALSALANQERQFETITISAKSFNTTSLGITNADIQNYYSQHKAEAAFQVPERVSISYVVLSQKGPADSTFESQKRVLNNINFQNNASLIPIQKALRLDIHTTPLFDASGDASDLVTRIPQVIKTAFETSPGKNSDLIPVFNQGVNKIIVLHVNQRVAPYTQALSEVKSQIIAILQKEKTARALQTLGETIQAKLVAGTSIENILSEYPSDALTHAEVGPVSRETAGIDPVLLNGAFSLPLPNDSQKSIGVVPLRNNDLAVVVLQKIIPGKPSANTVSLAEKLEKDNQTLYYSAYYLGLSKAAKITIG